MNYYAQKIKHCYKLALNWKLLIVSLLLGVLFAFLGARCWQINSYFWQLVCSLSLAITCYWYRCARLTNLNTEQLRLFLEYLSGKVSAGNTLENALLQSEADLARQLGAKSKFYAALHSLKQRLLMQVELSYCLKNLSDAFSLPLATTFFHSLGFLRQYGGRLDLYIRETHRSLCEEIQLEKAIRAEQSAKNSEAIILVFLPFFFAWLMGKSSGGYLDNLSGSHLATSIWHLLYVLSIIAGGLTCYLLSSGFKPKNKVPWLKLSKRPVKSVIIITLADALLNILPLDLSYWLKQALEQLAPEEASVQHAFYKYFRTKIYLSILAFSCCLILLLFTNLPLAFPLLLLALPLVQELDLWQRYDKLQLCYSLEYPCLLNLLSNLLSSGITLDKSLLLIESAYQTRPATLIAHELRQIRMRITSGQSAALALAEISSHLKHSDLVSSLNLIARYEQDGSQELLHILQLQASNSRQIYRDAMRKYLQHRSLKLLIPMSIDLLIVMATAVLPALLTLSELSF